MPKFNLFNKNNNTHVGRLIFFTFIVLFIIILSIDASLQQSVKVWIKNVLDFNPLNYIIIGASLTLGIFYSSYYVKQGKTTDLSLFKVFGPLLDPPANSLGYGLAISSTLTLFKGVYNQLFFDIIYFTDFKFIDVATILLACIPLLIWSIGGLLSFFIIIFFKSGGTTGTTESIIVVTEDSTDS